MNEVNVTPEEKQSIENLVGLGFTMNRAVTAFFTCEKNEELAANFLFEQQADEETLALNQQIAQAQNASMNVVSVQPEPPENPAEKAESQPESEQAQAEAQPEPQGQD